jgi:hypothetical protein
MMYSMKKDKKKSKKVVSSSYKKGGKMKMGSYKDGGIIQHD